MVPDYVRARALSNPLRTKLIMLFEGNKEFSVQEMAKLLDLPHGKVYYHVKKLLEAELLEESSRREINGIVERFFRIREEKIRIELGKSERMMGLNLVKSVICGLINDAGEDKEIFFTAGEVYLTVEEMDGLSKKLEDFIEGHREERPGTTKLTIAPLIIKKKTEERC